MKRTMLRIRCILVSTIQMLIGSIAVVLYCVGKALLWVLIGYEKAEELMVGINKEMQGKRSELMNQS